MQKKWALKDVLSRVKVSTYYNNKDEEQLSEPTNFCQEVDRTHDLRCQILLIKNIQETIFIENDLTMKNLMVYCNSTLNEQQEKMDTEMFYHLSKGLYKF